MIYLNRIPSGVIERVLSNLVRDSQAKISLIVDNNGVELYRSGGSKSADMQALSDGLKQVLSSISVLSSIVGGGTPNRLLIESAGGSISITNLDETSWLIVLYDSRTTVGMVNLFVSEAIAVFGRSHLIETAAAHEEAAAGTNETG